MAPPAVPRPATTVVGPHELQGSNARAEQPDGENQMDVGVVDFDYLEEKLVLIVDV